MQFALCLPPCALFHSILPLFATLFSPPRHSNLDLTFFVYCPRLQYASPLVSVLDQPLGEGIQPSCDLIIYPMTP
jgi:hypothetical protein